MRLALRTLRFSRSEEAAGEARLIPISKAFTFYLICAVIGLGANAAVFSRRPRSQFRWTTPLS